MKKISIALLLAGLLVAVIGCGDGSADTGTESKAADTAVDSASMEETEPSDPRQAVADDLPEKDYDGKPFRILLRETYEYEFDVKETDGDTINDAVFKRNTEVADRFNTSYECTAQSAEWNQGLFNNMISNTVLAGDNAYDLVAGFMCDITPTITKGIYLNWYDVPNINLEKPWWSSLMVEEFTINDRIYMITGDIALSYWKNMQGVAFNKSIAASLDLEDLYAVVREGRWTFDYMANICRDVSKDLNGDGAWDEKDMYGYTSNWSNEIDALKEAFDILITKKDKDGIPQFNVAGERTIEVLEGLAPFYADHLGYAPQDESYARIMFQEERALFTALKFHYVETLRSMETDFGILPFPKWNEAQTRYYTTVCDNASVMLTPITIDDPEFVGIITEALAAEGYKTLVPAYYDVVLKTKGSRDDDSAEMLDLIRDNLIIDFGYIHSTALDSVGHLFVNQVRTKTANIVSAFASKEKAAQKKLDAIVEFYFTEE